MLTGRVISLALAFLGVVGLVLWAALVYHPEDAKRAGSNYKRLSGTVAEGLVYSVAHEKHPRVICSACRVGKMKLGLVSLGAFNTIEFDDLVINVPESAPQTAGDAMAASADEPKGRSDVDTVVDALTLKPVMKMARANAKKFAGIRITNFQINRMAGDELLPVIKASALKNSGRRLMLYNVVLHRDGKLIELREAELITKPHLKIVWPRDSWDLSELLSHSVVRRFSGAPCGDTKESSLLRVGARAERLQR